MIWIMKILGIFMRGLNTCILMINLLLFANSYHYSFIKYLKEFKLETKLSIYIKLLRTIL